MSVNSRSAATAALRAGVVLAAAFALTACQGGAEPEEPVTPAPTEEPPVQPEETAGPAEGIDGEWCPTPESGETACVTVELPNATYDDGTIVKLFVAGEQEGGIVDYGMTDAPFGTYYPAGVAVEIPDYYPGGDLPDEDRVWNSQTATMLLRQKG